MLWIVQGVCAVCTIDTPIPDPTTVVMRGSIQASLRVTVVSILIAHKEVILGRCIWFTIMTIIMQLRWWRHHIRLRLGHGHSG